MATVEERLAALEARLLAAEDQLAIIRLLTSYGPLLDSGEATAAANLWEKGGSYDFGGGKMVTAPDEMIEMFEGEGYRHLIKCGVAHLTATPRITVNGDTAEAVAFSFVVVRDASRWLLWRAAVNHWSLVRTPVGWKIRERYNRTLDGSAESIETMRRALRG